MKGREKSKSIYSVLGVEAGRLRSTKLSADISGHSEVRILINAARDDARDILVPEDMGEAAGKAGSSLDGRVGRPPTVIGETESKDSLEGGYVDVLLEPDYVLVHVSDIFGIDEDEREIGIEAYREDILDVLIGQLGELGDITSLLEEVLLVIGDLDDEGDLEGLLQVLVEDERKHVTEMQGIRRRATSCVQIEGWQLRVLAELRFSFTDASHRRRG